MCIYSYKFKLQPPSKYSLNAEQYTLQDFFSTAQNSLWTCQFWWLLVLLFVFCFTASTSAKCFPLRTFFIPGNNKKNLLEARSGLIGRVGHGRHAVLGQKLLNISIVWAGALVNHPSWNGQTGWIVFKKNSLKPNASFHNNASWYSGTDGFLEYSPSGASLYYKGPATQKVIPVSGVPSCIIAFKKSC